MSQPAETVRVSAANLDRLLRSAGQLLTETMRQNVVARELTALSRQLDGLAKEGEAALKAAGPALRQLAATPGFAQAARYLAHVEQQVRLLARQTRTVRRLHQRSAWALGLLGGELQQDVRRVRMVAAESVFRGFRKMMRGLARDEGKEIDFRVSGFEIEADRMVLQALKDPLMHILCNAVSHGLEPPEERRRQGKNPVGRVALQLEAPGNRLMIRVEDDGRGIDFAKVAEVAAQRGFLSDAAAASASPEELGVLLFKPGFSTLKMVTDLSGRGMGLSVVFEAAARLQGEVQLRPRQPSGTVLLLSVPLMVSTQRLLLVSCRGQTFALPIHGIEGLLRVKFDEVEMVEGKPMLLLQRQPIPVLSLAALLDMSQPEAPPAGGSLPLILLRLGGRQVAVAVDAFVEERHGLIKDLDEPAARIGKLIGGILLEDGSVCLVLNLAEVIRTSKPSEQAPAWRKAEPAPLKKRSTVLVVDDSLTTRTLEKSILETHGYNVRIAIDGVEANSVRHGICTVRRNLCSLPVSDFASFGMKAAVFPGVGRLGVFIGHFDSLQSLVAP
jgi:two-component system chemotaxis sensor kinase CheA